MFNTVPRYQICKFGFWSMREARSHRSPPMYRATVEDPRAVPTAGTGLFPPPTTISAVSKCLLVGSTEGIP